MYAFVASAGGSIGLLAGGVLTQALSWHWIFFVNVPIGIATVVGALRLLPADKGLGLRAGADLPGAALITGALMLGVYTIVEPAAEQGWGAATTLGLGATSLALLAFFVAREATARTPLVPLRIFRSRAVSGREPGPGPARRRACSACSSSARCTCSGCWATTRSRPAWPSCPRRSRWALLSMRFTEPLISRFGAYRTLLPGVVLIGVGLAWFVRAPLDGTYVIDVLPTTLLLGIGAGLCFPALMTLAMSGATPEDAGLASGLVNTSAQVGGAIGLAVLATLSASRTESLAAAGDDAASAALRRLPPGVRDRGGRSSCSRSRWPSRMLRARSARPSRRTARSAPGRPTRPRRPQGTTARNRKAANSARCTPPSCSVARPGSTVSAPTTAVIASSTIWVGSSPSTSGPSTQMRGHRDRRDRQPDARDRRAEGEVEARLHPVAARVADGGERLGREHEQRDDHADRGLRRADGVDRVLDRRRLDLRQPDDRDQRDDQQDQAGGRGPAGRRVGVALVRRRPPRPAGSSRDGGWPG